MDEFLLVRFPGSRQLLLNGIRQGWTNMVIRLEAGTYDVALAGRLDFSPDRQTVTLRYTAPGQPTELTFHPLPPSAIVPDVT